MTRKMVLIVLAVLCVCLPATAEEAETLESILARHYEAIGGESAWQALETCRVKGSVVMAEGMEAPFVVTYRVPDKSRMEMTVREMTRVQAFDGETPWVMVPFAGRSEPQILGEEFIPMMREQAELAFGGPLIDWEAKGHLVDLVGREESGDGDVWHLRVTLADGGIRDYFIDSETFLPVSFEATTEFMGNELEIETTMDDYRTVGELTMAHSIRTGPRDAPEGQLLKIKSIELDVEVADDFFSVPGEDDADRDDSGG